MSFNVKVISTLNDKNAHEFSMFCDLCVTRMVRFRLKSFSCFSLLLQHVNIVFKIYISQNKIHRVMFSLVANLGGVSYEARNGFTN